MNIYFALLLISGLVTIFAEPAFSNELQENQHYVISKYLSNDLIDNNLINEEQLKNVYIDAFKVVYRNYWTVDFEEKVVEGYESYLNKFKNSSDMILFVAQKNEKIMGWSLFDICKENGQAVLELISVDPEYWRQGIGKKLIFILIQYFSEIKSIAVVTRKINAMSPLFYESFGFKKTCFTLPEYSSEEMLGYELIFAK